VIDPNTTRTWQYPRNANADMLMTFSLQGSSSQAIVVAAVPVITNPAAQALQPVRMGSCKGEGGVKGLVFWGPVGQPCNGIPPWGQYADSGAPQPAELCSCIGHGGIKGVGIWGPKDRPCAGIPDWGNYNQQCVAMTTAIICACTGHGDKIEGQVLWGPKDLACASMPKKEWGYYSAYCRAAN
jgi:hypothetical protein